MEPMRLGIRIDDGVSCTYPSGIQVEEPGVTEGESNHCRQGLRHQVDFEAQGSRPGKIGQQPGGSPGARKEPDYRVQGQRTSVGRL